MNKGLQALVAVTCMVVIGAAGYWGWQQYEGGQQASVADEFSSQRAVCLSAMRNLNIGAYKVRPVVDDCISKEIASLDDELAAEQTNK